MIYRIIILSLLFMASSCRSDRNLDFKDCDFDTDNEICLILPEVGCGDCIAGGVAFLLNHKEKFSSHQKRNKIIFTAISSVKMLKRALDDTDLDSLNCEIDTANRFLLPPPDGLYPIVVYLKEGKIKKIDIQNPNNTNVLKDLLKQL